MRYASQDKLTKNRVYNTVTPRSQEELESNQNLKVFTFTRDACFLVTKQTELTFKIHPTMHLSTMWVQTL